MDVQIIVWKNMRKFEKTNFGSEFCYNDVKITKAMLRILLIGLEGGAGLDSSLKAVFRILQALNTLFGC